MLAGSSFVPPHTARVQALTLVAFALVLAAFGCGGGGSGGGSDVASLEGTIQFAGGTSTVPAAEPNDSVDEAQPIGILHVGRSLTIEGSVSAPTGDRLDGFDLVAPTRMRVRASLHVDHPEQGRLELAVYDPVTLQFVARAEVAASGTASDQSVTIHARGAFDLVVQAQEGASSYRLSVASEPESDEAAEYLGALFVGEQVRVRSSTTVPATATRSGSRFVFTCPQAAQVSVQLTSLAGTPLEVALRDITLRNAPIGLAAFSSSTVGAETTLHASALSLIEVDVSASEALSEFELRIEAREAAPTASNAVVGARGLAPLSDELSSSAIASPEAFYGRPRLRAEPGELLVQSSQATALASALAARACRVIDRIPDGAQLVSFDLAPQLDAEARARATIAVARSFSGATGIDYCELNLLRQRLSVPNDPLYPLQWHYPLLRLPEAWDLSIGDDAVITAIIDTGSSDHPDVVNRQIAGYDFISKASNAADGNGIDSDPTDEGDADGIHPSSFHGTHVAGTIGAESDNGVGVAGVTWAGKLMHVRVLGKDGGSDFDISNAVRWSAGLSNNSNTFPGQRANVINMSLGGGGFNQTLKNAVTAARNAGVAIFAAAGNEDTSDPSYPAAYSGVISVAAVDINAKRAFYSNKGSTIDVCAPGGDVSVDLDQNGFGDGVLSTKIDDGTQPPAAVYAFEMGTSMACPHAAGVAALMYAVNPTLTPAQVEMILEDTATDLGAVGRDDLYGEGLIDAYLAVLVAGGGSVPGAPALSLTPTALSFGESQSALTIAVKNVGGGVMDVSTVIANSAPGENWLLLHSSLVQPPTTTNVRAITATVNRAGLAQGTYMATIHVDSDGGSIDVPVSMVVSSNAPAKDVEIFVLAVDVDSLETVAEVVVNPLSGLAYSLDDLPAGEYVIAAGSDDDGDGIICGEGDLYCGLYPTLNEPVVIEVDEGDSISNLDFPVTAQTVSPLQALPPILHHPIKLLHRGQLPH